MIDDYACDHDGCVVTMILLMTIMVMIALMIALTDVDDDCREELVLERMDRRRNACGDAFLMHVG